MHRYQYCFGSDGDYIAFESFCPVSRHWVAHTYWLIPNSQIED